MPSERFFKIKEAKREKIMEIALEEFINNPYHSVSINKIIKDADISRGSFYTYFEDKNDLFNYLLSDFIETFFIYVSKTVENNDGDFFKAVEYMLDRAMDDSDSSLDFRLFRSLLEDLNIIDRAVDRLGTGGRKMCYLRNPYLFDKISNIYEKCKSLSDKIDLQKFILIFDMILTLSLRVLAGWVLDKTSKDMRRKALTEQIKIIELGIIRTP